MSLTTKKPKKRFRPIPQLRTYLWKALLYLEKASETPESLARKNYESLPEVVEKIKKISKDILIN